jgi:hypothetical protein
LNAAAFFKQSSRSNCCFTDRTIQVKVSCPTSCKVACPDQQNYVYYWRRIILKV